MQDTAPNGPQADDKVVLAGQEERKGARADFISSLLLLLIGIFTIIESLRMPRFESWGSYARPGLTPIVVASCLILASLIIFIRSLCNGGYRLNITAAGAAAFCKADMTRRFLFTLFMITLYLLCLGKTHFVVVSVGFLFCMMIYFRASKWWISMAVAFVVAFLTWYLFEKIFLVPLP